MKKGKRNSSKGLFAKGSASRKITFGILAVILVVAYLSSNSFRDEVDELLGIGDTPKESIVVPRAQGDLLVHFIDVGQGDSILIQFPGGENMLIDAGDNDKGQIVVDYLQGQGVQRIDHLVGTHPHADHIGGLDDVIKEFDIGDVYMPKVSHTSKTYMDVLEAVDEKGLTINAASAGMSIPSKEANIDILAPDSELESKNLNDYSIVIRLVYGETKFLFQGDAEKKTEEELLLSGANVKADVLKLGHHGSSTSNIEEYIKAVDPDYAVAPLGEDNKYGHPHKEVVELLDNMGIVFYRTDKDGTVIVVSDGENISVNP